VNYAVEQSFLRYPDSRTVSLELTIDTTISQVMEYFEISGSDADVSVRSRAIARGPTGDERAELPA